MSWPTEAACRDITPAAQNAHFYPGSSGRPAPESAYEYAKRRWCARCPVAEQCLTDALAREERHGLWGGRTPRERGVIQAERYADRDTPSTVAVLPEVAAAAVAEYEAIYGTRQGAITWTAIRFNVHPKTIHRALQAA